MNDEVLSGWSEVLPNVVDTSTSIAEIRLAVPFMSSFTRLGPADGLGPPPE